MSQLNYVRAKKYADQTVSGTLNGTFHQLAEEQKSKNLFNKDSAIKDQVPWYNSGEMQDYEGFYGSDWMPVRPNTLYTRSPAHAICFYGPQKNFISGVSSSATNGTERTPPHCYYVRVAIRAEDLEEFQLEEGEEPTSYEPFYHRVLLKKEVITNDHTNPWRNQKIIFQGDSITDPDYNSSLAVRYPDYVARSLGAEEDNYALSGSTIAAQEEDPTARDPIVLRYEEMDDEAEMIIVAAGTNDWYYSATPLGDMESRDAYTFYGALHVLCLGLLKKYKYKNIVFLTPIMRRQSSFDTPSSTNANGKTLREYGDIIREVCRHYSIPVLDMYGESGLFPFDDELAVEYFNEQEDEGVYYYTHPNANGQQMMGKRLVGFLKQLA